MPNAEPILATSILSWHIVTVCSLRLEARGLAETDGRSGAHIPAEAESLARRQFEAFSRQYPFAAAVSSARTALKKRCGEAQRLGHQVIHLSMLFLLRAEYNF